jgi:hypothetical protein
MKHIQTLQGLKEVLQAGFDDNEALLEQYGQTHITQLKAYLLETNRSIDEVGCPLGRWKSLDASGWYINHGSQSPNTLFLDTTRERVWILYTVLDATEADAVTDKWIRNLQGLDRCWLSRNHLLHYDAKESWQQRGLGLKFSDGLASDEKTGYFSLKAWYGATEKVHGLAGVLETARENFAIYSSRWQKLKEDSVTLAVEWYSSGKVTVNKAIDLDEVMLSISDMANRYEDALVEATTLRDESLGAFELNFTQNIDLEAFSKAVSMGKGRMNLWLIETETEPDFRRFKGVDLHTWDRVFLDVGSDFAYLTVPGKGCVNAAPRIATIQGEDNAGKTSIFFDGVEVFA